MLAVLLSVLFSGCCVLFQMNFHCCLIWLKLHQIFHRLVQNINSYIMELVFSLQLWRLSIPPGEGGIQEYSKLNHSRILLVCLMRVSINATSQSKLDLTFPASSSSIQITWRIRSPLLWDFKCVQRTRISFLLKFWILFRSNLKFMRALIFNVLVPYFEPVEILFSSFDLFQSQKSEVCSQLPAWINILIEIVNYRLL